MKIIQITRYGIVLLLSSLLIACGNQEEAPPGSEIVINPSEITWDLAIGACSGIYPGVAPHMHIHRISLFGPRGEALGNTEFQISMTLTQNVGVGGVSWLVVDLNEDGKFDNWNFDPMAPTWDAGPEVITLSDKVVPYTLETNEFGWLDVGLMLDLGGCEYSGYFFVSSGSASNAMAYEVTAQ